MAVPIISISTPIGNSAIGIIRLSFGNKIKINFKNLFNKIFKKNLINRKATLVNFYFKNCILDKGLAIFFNAPKTYTGEDILEFHGHGNFLNLKFILKKFLIILKNKKLRLAKNGEFTKRAFLNKKINLIEAENILNLINVNNNFYLNFVHYNFKYDLFKKLKKLFFIIKDIKIKFLFSINKFVYKHLKLNINYRLLYILKKLLEIYNNYKLKNKIIDLSIIILGLPNTGKSTLINKIIKDNTLIVSSIPGTTRDFVVRRLNIGDYNINLIDTAGLRETNNKLENFGIKLALKQLKLSNIVLYIFDNNLFINRFYNKIINLVKNCKIFIKIFNKVDLLDNISNLEIYYDKKKIYIKFKISAKYNLGINLIINELDRLLINFNKLNNSFFDVNLIKNIKYIYNHILNIYRFNNNLNIDFFIKEIEYSIYFFNKMFNFNNKNDLNKFFKRFCIGK